MAKPHLDYDERLEQQYRRLGTRNPTCVGCPEKDPFCLELHHLAGQRYHGDLVIVCRNCHRKLTNQQHEDTGGSEQREDSVLATIGRYLLGLCALLALILKTLREFGMWLIEAARERSA